MTDRPTPDRIRQVLHGRALSMEVIAERLQCDLVDLRPALWNMTRSGEVELSKTYSLAPGGPKRRRRGTA